MGIDDELKNRLKQKIDSKEGIHVSVSVDIRKVENFFKKLFGRKKKTEDKKDGRRKKDRG
jgi:predicted DNA-binding antitoxin AbrB/MazE fold protein